MQSSKRLPRIERDEEVMVHEDENAHLWAVSYSDFLMALLSFFILFFSMETPNKEKFLINLAADFNEATGHGLGSKSGDGSGLASNGLAGRAIRENTAKTVERADRLPSSVFSALQGLDVVVDKERHILTVNFPDDIYQPGEHVFKPERMNILKTFLSVMKPYAGKVNLYFEGHADATPLQKKKNEIIVDNFVLSSLRATSALAYARDHGMSEKHLFIQAAASNIRNSRSLSVRIEPVEGASL